MYIDLDNFKVINDACGHAAGDQLLRQVSVLLQGALRGRDTVARLGGDEFGVILEMCNIEQGREIAQKICNQIEQYRFAHDGRRYRIGSSIGVVPVDLRWLSSAAVMQAADSCCYAAKDDGRNRVHLWVESDSTLMARQGEMQWVNRLEAAIDENRFVLFAQHIEPIGAQTTGLHCEVLLRLRQDDGSMILPGSFLPAAERFHLMARIDKWVLHKVIEMLEADAIDLERIDTIAVNLSGQSIGDRAFHRDLIRMLQEARFDTKKLCFEITETAAITNLGDAKVLFEEVRSLGVRIALDDFGAGASSFGYLRILPIDFLKIDGQYIAGLADPLNNAAVRCFCEVAKAVGVKTIAEFVESSGSRDALSTIGVDMVQGFLIHHPEPLAVLLPCRTTKRQLAKSQHTGTSILH
jgi:diguanylate cyclase (GGDEF)-like protein